MRSPARSSTADVPCSARLRYCLLIVFAVGTAAAIARADQAGAVDTTADDAQLIRRGEYLSKAADCGACHSAPGGAPFAGGLAISSPVGTIYASNITPSISDGIGRYSEQQFEHALRGGIRSDGAHLYPAMPYTSYCIFTDADVRALYRYFLKAVAPVDSAAPRTELSFPMNIRASMFGWNLLFLHDRPLQPDPQQSEAWNRGRYLVQGAAHCGACHTPRGFLMQEEQARLLGGGHVGPWFAPNITPDVDSGIGSWSQEELVQYLATGVVRGKAQAAGSMGEAVEHSFQYLSAADLNAIATYVRTVPAIHDADDRRSRFAFGKASSSLGVLRGKSAVRADEGTPSGAELFQGNCASCHAPLGRGSTDGYYPSLFSNSALGSSNPNNLIATILNGVNRTTSSGQAYMPGFAGGTQGLAALSDQQIVLLGDYLLEHYGRPGVVITAAQVAEVRRGGPSSSLVLLARAGVAAAVIVLILIVAYVAIRVRAGSKRT
jgi:fructose 5-dehydrogenase cytochrome subunit